MRKLEEGSATRRRGNGSRSFFGGWANCSSSWPCSSNMGDCDNDNQCQVRRKTRVGPCYLQYRKVTKRLQLRWQSNIIFQPSLTRFPFITSLSGRRSNQWGCASVARIKLNWKVVSILNYCAVNTGQPIGSLFATALYGNLLPLDSYQFSSVFTI